MGWLEMILSEWAISPPPFLDFFVMVVLDSHSPLLPIRYIDDISPSFTAKKPTNTHPRNWTFHTCLSLMKYHQKRRSSFKKSRYLGYPNKVFLLLMMKPISVFFFQFDNCTMVQSSPEFKRLTSDSTLRSRNLQL